MKRIKIVLLAVVLPLLMATGIHKFYVSVTEIDYVKEKKSVQIVMRIFVDDLETVLKKRYDAQLVLTEKNESKDVDMYLQRYIKEKFQVKINGATSDYVFLGKEYETDIVYCYLEIKNISNIKSFEIVNKLLFDVFDEQQNIVKTNINSQNKSFILIPQNDKGLLNFK